MLQHCVWFGFVLTFVAHFSYSFSFSLIPCVASLESFFFFLLSFQGSLYHVIRYFRSSHRIRRWLDLFPDL